MSREFRIKNGQLQMIETSELDTKKVVKVLEYLLENTIIEFRGGRDDVDGITTSDMYNLESFGLVKEVEEAWHTSYVLSEESKPILEMIRREVDLHLLLKDEE